MKTMCIDIDTAELFINAAGACKHNRKAFVELKDTAVIKTIDDDGSDDLLAFDDLLVLMEYAFESGCCNYDLRAMIEDEEATA